MKHALILSLLSQLLWLPATASECIIFPEERGETIARYVQDADQCLREPPKKFRFDETIEAQVFHRINAERRNRGLSELGWRSELLGAARIHSLDMAMDNFFSHRGPDGRRVADRVGALDRHLIRSEIRENIAAIKGDQDWAQADRILHTILMNSDGHRENILAPRLTHMTMGVVRTDRGAWLTQIFVTQEGHLEMAVPTQISSEYMLEGAPQLDRWNPVGLYVDTGADPLPLAEKSGDDTPLGLGNIELLLRAERPLADGSGKEVIYLIAPGATLD